MKEIQLYSGETALIDDADYELVSSYSWYKNKSGYAVNKQMQYMHRLILELKVNDGKVCDHIDHNKLNNQKSNLRICNRWENGKNRKARANSISTYLGVSFHKTDKLWFAKITIRSNGIKSDHWLGTYKSEELAARAYDSAALYYHGEYANPNFKDSIARSIEEIKSSRKLNQMSV